MSAPGGSRVRPLPEEPLPHTVCRLGRGVPPRPGAHLASEAHAMEIAVLRERHAQERRVALAPDHVPQLGKLGLGVRVEAGAGAAAAAI
mgnify:CR=1 FL=1